MIRTVKSNYGNTYTEIFIHNRGEIVSDNMVATNNFFEIDFLDF